MEHKWKKTLKLKAELHRFCIQHHPLKIKGKERLVELKELLSVLKLELLWKKNCYRMLIPGK